MEVLDLAGMSKYRPTHPYTWYHVYVDLSAVYGELYSLAMHRFKQVEEGEGQGIEENEAVGNKVGNIADPHRQLG